MIRALDSGNGVCSFMYVATSLLLTAPRLGLRALDREAAPVAGWRVIPRRRAWAADGTQSVGKPAACPLGAAAWLGSIAGPARAWRRDPSHCGENCSEIPEQFGSVAGNRK